MKNIPIKINNQGYLIPDNDSRRYILNELKIDKEYMVKIIKSRNIRHNSKYWVLLKALAFHFPQISDDDETWHYFFKEKFLPLKEMHFGDRVKLYPSSTAFDKMSQIEFDEYYKKVDNYLLEKGYQVDELINTMEV